ncbi:PREDICTED: receptor-type tyrosine-protein phosphatase delta-like isoform X2 [Amphimedon queenslandica]|uniref:protein-tyrosine-phosphatase n=1 Tax=Amphimedon queenslandica TaxID=400682 RepID=A0AAN0JHE2_AMPQE|nr:PREDICTED: receptor-type tyrosine-protein phosphatase delta-like isoform X2 [Amphimedon queenslandica]|eukprot:XP_019856078.1 PREDICTED: receptor-type tyrosine-protein phosphatase delta-like isoform X2 [Amphimedon queenslandica]
MDWPLFIKVLTIFLATTCGVRSQTLSSPDGLILSDVVTAAAGLSDLLIEVNCSSSGESPLWLTADGDPVSSPLSTFGITQDNEGLLRVYPGTEVLKDDTNTYNCSLNNGYSSIIRFNTVESMFYTNVTLRNGSLYCPLPDYPLSSSLINESLSIDDINYLYCNATTERGSFISQFISINEVVPTYIIQPVDVHVPVNGTAAFSCSISPDSALINITWYSSEGMVASEDVINDFNDPGLSVLVINNVTESEGGVAYYCVAYFKDRAEPVRSNNASLLINDLVISTFILTPPVNLSILEFTNVSIPCIPNEMFTVTWSSTGAPATNITDESINIININRNNSGIYYCTASNGDTAAVSVNVLFAPEFISQIESETILPVGDSVVLSCTVTGSPAPMIRWYRDGSIMNDGIATATEGLIIQSNLTLANLQQNQTGVYQCVFVSPGVGGVAYFNSIVSSTYLLVQFIGVPTISPILQDPVNPLLPQVLTFNCTVDGRPLVNITWDVGSTPFLSISQPPVDFIGPALSTIQINSSLLAGTVPISCYGNDTVNATAIINAFSPVSIVQDPLSPPIIVLRGDTVSFSCLASSIPVPNITWFRNDSSGPVSLFDDTESVVSIISTSTDGLTTNSTLTITLESDGEYFCFASNDFFNDTSEPATVLRGFIPVIITNPSAPPVVINSSIIINCTSEGFPLPAISWLINETNLTGVDEFTVNTEMMSANRSVSTLSGNINNNNTRLVCVASNIFNDSVRSEEIVQLISGPPLSPSNSTIDPMARSVSIQWTPPFSLLPISSYSLSLSTGTTFNIINNESLIIIINGTHISPFTNYSFSLTATNPAGTSPPATFSFESLQDVPVGSPTIVSVFSTSNDSLSVSWSEIPPEETNGPIINYTIQFKINNNDNQDMFQTVNTTQLQFTLTGLSGGTEYIIQVAGNTVIGHGPFSNNVTQSTVNNPPPIANETIMTVSQSITANTVPILIPENINRGGAVFLIWVVVVKLNGSLTNQLFSSSGPTVSPDVFYRNNDSFISSVDTPVIPAGRPYIAAELLLSSLTLPHQFIIGDNDNTGNLQPGRYSNPPLAAATSYTYFIRAFPPAPPSNSNVRSKRETGAPQFSVFSSTRFSDPVDTLREAEPTPVDSLSSGAIAGIVVSLLILVTLLVFVALIAAFVFVRPKATSNIPPAARRGSMRLTESQKVSLVNDLKKVPAADIPELTPSDQRQSISVSMFPDYVKRLHANTDHLFSEEYELITIKSPSLPHEASQQTCNIEKNRYGNINSFDETRVVLTKIPGIEGSDYINANYIDGYGSRDTYIACQGPLAETSPDFWRMIWEQKTSCIVMLTNCVEKGRPKCHQYWPQTGSTTFGELTVTIIDQQVLAYYTIRTFKINNKDDESFEVKQFHYTAWPDFGVPDHPNPIISFIRRVNNSTHTGPLVVHCSAGVGRSGTFIAIQSMMLMMETEGKVDVFNFVLDMRHKRNYMVQTEAQYMFVHDSLVELIKVGNSEQTVQNFPKEAKILLTTQEDNNIEDAVSVVTALSPLPKQFEKLNSIDVAIPSQYISASLPVNRAKNRYPDILPYESYRVRLLMLPGVSGSDYINASYVDGYLRCNQFIMTQGPLSNTVDDFWRMIWEHRVSAIVMLCGLVEDGKDQSVQYWPKDQLTQYGDMFIETISETDTGFYVIREITITHTKQGNEVRNIKQFHYTDWSENKTPPTTGALMDMIVLVQKAHHLFGGGPVVVHDSSSVGRSGTFCIINIVIERLKVEGMIDIFFTIHALRRKHPGIVANYDQFKFCYQTIVEYLESFDKYANFD